MEIISPLDLIFSFDVLMLILASYFDIKSREVPDILSYILIFGNVFLLLLCVIYYYNLSMLEFLPLSLALFFGFPYAMYRLGQWGGGDVKLMTGLGLVFTSINIYSNLSFINLFINILLFGGLYGLVATLVYGLIKFKRMAKELKLYDIPIVVSAVIGITVSAIYFQFPFNILISFIVFLLFTMRYLYIIMDKLMYITVKTDRLTEGDWLAEDIIKDGKVIVKRRNIGLLKEDIEKLRKERIEQVPIKIGLPFVPGFLIGLLITIIFVNPVFTVLFSM